MVKCWPVDFYCSDFRLAVVWPGSAAIFDGEGFDEGRLQDVLEAGQVDTALYALTDSLTLSFRYAVQP